MSTIKVESRPGKQPELGFFVKIAHAAVSVILSEAARGSTLILDAEHGAFGDSDLEVLCELIHRGNGVSMVRVSAPDRLAVSRAIDRGADSVMIPRVESAAMAAEIVQGMRTAPRGRRGWDPTTAALGYGTRTVETRAAKRCHVQIETRGAANDARAIAELEGVTDLFVGPADLSLELTGMTELFAQETVEFVEALPGIVSGTGVGLGLYVESPARAAWAARLGYTFLAIGSDVGMLAAGVRRLVADTVAAVG